MAEVAGIIAAKNTSTNLPLCHPITIDFIKIQHELNEKEYTVTSYAIVSCVSKTGVEMEALSAASTALLTIYDLCKMYSKNLKISNIELLMKHGGKSGIWLADTTYPSWINEYIPQEKKVNLSSINTAVITLSDRAASKVYEDKSGMILKNIFEESGAFLTHYSIIPDDTIEFKKLILELTETNKHLLIITTGSTGLSNRDIAPNVLQEISQKELVGIGELLRQYSSTFTPFAWLSRTSAYEVNSSLVICLPGSSKAVKECMDVLLPLIPHMHAQLTGKNHD